MKILLLPITFVLGACASYPPPTAYPAIPDAHQAQAAADAQCARTGKLAVRIKAPECSSAQCVTSFECR